MLRLVGAVFVVATIALGVVGPSQGAPVPPADGSPSKDVVSEPIAPCRNDEERARCVGRQFWQLVCNKGGLNAEQAATCAEKLRLSGLSAEGVTVDPLAPASPGASPVATGPIAPCRGDEERAECVGRQFWQLACSKRELTADEAALCAEKRRHSKE